MAPSQKGKDITVAIEGTKFHKIITHTLENKRDIRDGNINDEHVRFSHLEKLISTAAKRCKSLLGNFPQQLLRIHLNRMVFSFPTIPNAAGKGPVPQPKLKHHPHHLVNREGGRVNVGHLPHVIPRLLSVLHLGKISHLDIASSELYMLVITVR